MKGWGRKPEYPKKTSDNEDQKTPHRRTIATTETKKKQKKKKKKKTFKPRLRLEPAHQHSWKWLAGKAILLAFTSHFATCRCNLVLPLILWDVDTVEYRSSLNSVRQTWCNTWSV